MRSRRCWITGCEFELRIRPGAVAGCLTTARAYFRAEEPASGIIPLLLAGHSARIAYEGSRFVRSEGAGVPSLAALPQPEYADVTARARHASKLFDDDKKSYEDLLDEMRSYLDAHHAEFTGNARFRWARRFETDLGTFLLQRDLLSVTATLPFRFGEPPDTPIADLGPRVFAVATERSGELLVLSAVTGMPWNQQPTVAAGPHCSHRYGRRMTSPLFDALFLASDEASFITGVALPVDGGLTAY